MALAKASQFLLSWYEADEPEADVALMEAFAELLSTSLKAVPANLSKILSFFDRDLRKQGFSKGFDDMEMDILKYFQQICLNFKHMPNMITWALVVESRLHRLEQELAVDAVDEESLVSRASGRVTPDRLPSEASPAPKAISLDEISHDVNVVPAASDLPKLEEVKPVLAPPAAQVISKTEVQAPLRAKVFVPKYKKGDYMVDHVDRFDLFIKRASVLQSERELFFVDSLNNVHDQATLFDDMRHHLQHLFTRESD